MHAYVCILIQYVVVWVSRGTLFSVVFAFVFQMGYLLAGNIKSFKWNKYHNVSKKNYNFLIEYYLTESEKYDIKWT